MLGSYTSQDSCRRNERICVQEKAKKAREVKAKADKEFAAKEKVRIKDETPTWAAFVCHSLANCSCRDPGCRCCRRLRNVAASRRGFNLLGGSNTLLGVLRGTLRCARLVLVLSCQRDVM